MGEEEIQTLNKKENKWEAEEEEYWFWFEYSSGKSWDSKLEHCLQFWAKS